MNISSYTRATEDLDEKLIFWSYGTDQNKFW